MRSAQRVANRRGPDRPRFRHRRPYRCRHNSVNEVITSGFLYLAGSAGMVIPLLPYVDGPHAMGLIPPVRYENGSARLRVYGGGRPGRFGSGSATRL